MPSILHVGAAVLCPHAAPATVIPTQTRVLLSGQPAATMADQFLVTGCAFAPVSPSPCLRIQWTVPAARVVINGSPAILQSSMGLGLGPTQAPQGPAVVTAAQPRVQGM